MRFITLLAAAAMVGCSWQSAQAQTQITNHEAPGNLQAQHPLHCVPLSGVSSKDTPADIYPGVAACIKAGDFGKAARLFALAGALGRFDQLRVADVTARDAVRILKRQNFANISREQRTAFKKALVAALGPKSSSRGSICSAVASLGPPTYFPT